MTLLSILACQGIAVPMSSSFPPTELRYIMDNSDALALLYSENLQDKAEEIIKEGLERPPILHKISENIAGGNPTEPVHLEPVLENTGGIMLYTSGTTNRPVSSPFERLKEHKS